MIVLYVGYSGEGSLGAGFYEEYIPQRKQWIPWEDVGPKGKIVLFGRNTIGGNPSDRGSSGNPGNAAKGEYQSWVMTLNLPEATKKKLLEAFPLVFDYYVDFYRGRLGLDTFAEYLTRLDLDSVLRVVDPTASALASALSDPSRVPYLGPEDLAFLANNSDLVTLGAQFLGLDPSSLSPEDLWRVYSILRPDRAYALWGYQSGVHLLDDRGETRFRQGQDLAFSSWVKEWKAGNRRSFADYLASRTPGQVAWQVDPTSGLGRQRWLS